MVGYFPWLEEAQQLQPSFLFFKADPADVKLLEIAIKNFKVTWRDSSPDSKNNVRGLFPKMKVFG